MSEQPEMPVGATVDLGLVGIPPLPSTAPGSCHLGHVNARRSEVGPHGVLVWVEFCPVCEGNGTVQAPAEVPHG
jgi:hypothetical protein